jgi:dephospho-CoA kinase
MSEDEIMRIGVTGGIASGKSLVASILGGLGAFVVDADEVYHGLIEPGMPLFNAIVARWGGVVLEDGHLDRKRLGAIVFSEPEERKYLEEITHPATIKAMEEKLDSAGTEHQVLVAPLLLEAGQRHLVDQVWLVVVDSETRISRLMARENITREDALKRIASQMPDEEKIRQASEVIYNNGAPDETAEQVRRLWEKIEVA